MADLILLSKIGSFKCDYLGYKQRVSLGVGLFQRADQIRITSIWILI
jgi:hypothetical protein